MKFLSCPAKLTLVPFLKEVSFFAGFRNSVPIIPTRARRLKQRSKLEVL